MSVATRLADDSEGKALGAVESGRGKAVEGVSLRKFYMIFFSIIEKLL